MPKRSSAAAPAQHPLISDQQLRHLYVTLLRCRLLRRRNRVSPAALVAREAIVTGTVTHLKDGDTVAAAAGDRLAALARGHTLRSILAGKPPMPGVLPDAPTAEARFAIAAGYALAQQQQDEKGVVLAFSGPSITSLDALRPALILAAQSKLGILFVIETAADADVSSPRHTDPLGIYGIPVDGNDVVAIYRVAQEAITRARRGLGPTLIDCKPWPLDGSMDSVSKLEMALLRRGLSPQPLRQRTEDAFHQAVTKLRKKA